MFQFTPLCMHVSLYGGILISKKKVKGPYTSQTQWAYGARDHICIDQWVGNTVSTTLTTFNVPGAI